MPSSLKSIRQYGARFQKQMMVKSAKPMRRIANVRGSSSASRARRTEAARVHAQSRMATANAKNIHPTSTWNSGGAVGCRALSAKNPSNA